MASAVGNRKLLASHEKKPPINQASGPPIPGIRKKGPKSPGGTNSKHSASATAVSRSGFKSAQRQRPSDVLNPKTIDPVSKTV